MNDDKNHIRYASKIVKVNKCKARDDRSADFRAGTRRASFFIDA